ncbi:tetratricopeptide repeat protein [uncultured Jannaschia sp.]|uniref:tetratricopeptide repeat protein n=1 Tax=uncultured Jannaschia sp. TaxID=293347 RepID=UPI002627DCD6|nr:tetratricopeptide repeat protein [uncultured Jannaschia sp.]
MTIGPGFRLTATAIVVALALTGCKSDDARVSELRASGDAYVAERDFARALIQYRNVLKIDGDDVETRAALGHMFLSQGYLREASREFTLLAERQPDVAEWRLANGRIAMLQADWTALGRHAEAAADMEPDGHAARILDMAVRFRAAIRDDDAAARAALEAEALPFREAYPDEPILTRIVLESAIQAERTDDALALLDDTLARDPYRPDLQLTRIRLLAEGPDPDPVEDRLHDLVALYPDDTEFAGLLVARYMSRGRMADAEDVLRALADGRPLDDLATRTMLVRFLLRNRGSDAALAELARQREAAGDGPGALVYAAMDRAIRFDAGDRDGALAGLDELVAAAGEGTEARMIRVLRARMLDRLGEHGPARAEIETVLEADPGDVGALKMRAGWAIDGDRPKDAVVDLRTALSIAPRDTELLGLMAAAHRLDGNPGLAMEQLATAAEVSGHAVGEAGRYARALIGQGRDRLALRVLQAAHEGAPGHVPTAMQLADVLLDLGDVTQATAVAARLRAAKTEGAAEAATALSGAIAMRDPAASIDITALYVPGQVRQPALTGAVGALADQGRPDAALEGLDDLITTHPDAMILRLIRADMLALADRTEDARTGYEALTGVADLGETATIRLFGLHAAAQRVEDANTALAAGLRAFPESVPLRLLDADRLTALGDSEAAIVVLEALHSEQPGHPTVANNLAALLSTTRDDPASLARAARLAAPLRGDPRPQVADTIGWIAFRRGDVEGALPLMRRAARELPDDPVIRLRLGRVQAAHGDVGHARETFAAVETLTGPDHPLAAEARDARDALPTGG